MSILQSIFLGLIQGLTEFLPVSSSGHLAIAQNLFHIDTGNSILFNILMHVATVLVVIWYFRTDIWMLILAVFGMIGDAAANVRIPQRNKTLSQPVPLRRIVKNNYRKYALLLIVATIPTGIIGVLGKKLISDASSSLLVPGICLIITGILLLVSDRVENTVKIPQDIRYQEAAIVGIAQGFATLPGLSRSGTTIAASLLCGFDRMFAVRFSFILSVPAILGAAILEIGDVGSETITAAAAGTYAAGMITAAVVGFVCIRIMLATVRKRKTRYFAFYCFAAGILAIAGKFLLRG